MIALWLELAALYVVAGLAMAMGPLDRPELAALHARLVVARGVVVARSWWVVGFVLAVALWPLLVPRLVRALLWPPLEDSARPRPRPPWGSA